MVTTATDLKFSIIIPTYNEEKVIERTLQLLIGLDYPNKEIIVVDDSKDSTPDIVRKFEKKGVVLIRPKVRGGRCEARNIGIRESKGDVVIILNADVFLPQDFLIKVKKYYDSGYDSVGVKPVVANTELSLIHI